jgi:hypothetical protein
VRRPFSPSRPPPPRSDEMPHVNSVLPISSDRRRAINRRILHLARLRRASFWLTARLLAGHARHDVVRAAHSRSARLQQARPRPRPRPLAPHRAAPGAALRAPRPSSARPQRDALPRPAAPPPPRPPIHRPTPSRPQPEVELPARAADAARVRHRVSRRLNRPVTAAPRAASAFTPQLLVARASCRAPWPALRTAMTRATPIHSPTPRPRRRPAPCLSSANCHASRMPATALRTSSINPQTARSFTSHRPSPTVRPV